MNRALALATLSLSIMSASFPGSVRAEPSFVSGNTLWEFCGSMATGPVPDACSLFVAGVIDARKYTQHELKVPQTVCLAGTVETGQAADIVRQYLAQYPERRGYQAASLAIDALQMAFPCPDASAR
jgi:hypothetical protein